MKTIRVACGQGFWGDSPEAPVQLLNGGGIDYLILDYLAEVTMSILARHRSKNPQAGFARDFVDLMERMLPQLAEQNVSVLSNAGGMNPRACGEAVAKSAARLGLQDRIRVAVVEGDDISGSLDVLRAQGEKFAHMESGAPFDAISSRIRSANIYLGCEGLVEALRAGANVVITGRVADPSLALAPMVHAFGWPLDDWDRLASGIVAGHLIECGAQCSGGNCSVDWESIPSLSTVGYPIIEMSADGSFAVTKQPGTGGRIDERSVKEQLVYEIGDPRSYITPDVTADFTSLSLVQDGVDRVCIRGVKGHAKPPRLKVSMSYSDGYTAAGTILYSWPQAYRKARAAGEIVQARLNALGLRFEKIHTEIVGANACHGTLSDRDDPDLPEATLRIAVRGPDEKAVERFTREMPPLVLNGPPSATAYFGARGEVREVIAYWPTLIERSAVTGTVSVLSGGK